MVFTTADYYFGIARRCKHALAGILRLKPEFRPSGDDH